VRVVKAAQWADPSAIKQMFRSADILRDGRVVSDIGGNKYRLVAWVNYQYGIVYVRFIGTHRDYDRIDAQTV
jgi:mRNA interferase HigB